MMWHDLRFGIRTFFKNPGFAAVAIVALGLGIGVNATIFSLVNGILFKSPFSHSERILYISSQDRKNPEDEEGVSQPDLDDLRAQLKSVAGLAAAARHRVNLSADAQAPDTYVASRVTVNAFSVAGLPPILGRDFTAADAKPNAAPVAILTAMLWQSRYGKDPGIIGRTIRIDTVPTTIIGISAPGLAIPPETELWMPYIPDSRAKRQDRSLVAFARLAPGVTQAAALSEIALAGERLAAQHPDTNGDYRFHIRRFADAMVPNRIRTIFLILLGAVGFVLLIACANVANLLLSRAAGRVREISIRAALGAGRWRVVRQLLTESLLLAIGGGVVALAIAEWGVRAFDAAVTPTGKPQWINFAMDYRAFGYLAVVTIATAILFGLAPALRLSRMDIESTLKGGGRTSSAMHGRFLSAVLVVTEMMLAVVLLTGAGLMIRSFLIANARPMGIDTNNILVMRVELPIAKYRTPSAQLDFERRLIDRVREVAGVETAAMASGYFGNGNFTFPYEIDGKPADAEHRPATNFLFVGSGYFEMLRLAASRGRILASADYTSGPGVAVINETMAHELWPNQDPIGRRIRFFRNDTPMEWMTVAGVVPDYLQNIQRPGHDAVAIIPFRELPQSWMTVLARTRVNAASLANPFRRAVLGMDPDLPVRDLMTLDDQLALARWPLRVFGSMFTIFAAIALLLATVGLYAVVAYGVTQRTREIGVRVALGASAGSILRMVLMGGMLQAVIGLALGIAISLAVSRVLKAILFGLSPTDPLTFGIVPAVLLAAAILGCAVPARRALRVDPAIALRHE